MGAAKRRRRRLILFHILSKGGFTMACRYRHMPVSVVYKCRYRHVHVDTRYIELPVCGSQWPVTFIKICINSGASIISRRLLLWIGTKKVLALICAVACVDEAQNCFKNRVGDAGGEDLHIPTSSSTWRIRESTSPSSAQRP